MADYDCSDNGIYVWRDTRRGGCSIGDDDIEELVSFAKIKKLKEYYMIIGVLARHVDNHLGTLVLVVNLMSFYPN